VRSFDGLAAALPDGTARVEANGTAEDVLVARVSANLFDVLGLRPSLGRFFGPDEEVAGRDTAIVLAHSAWVRLFNGDAGVIGRRVTLVRSKETATYEVVGVLPEGVTYPVTSSRPTEIFRPYVPSANDRIYALRSRGYFVDVVGRLKPDVAIPEARADVDRVTAAARAAYDMREPVESRIVVLPLHDRIVGRAKRWLLLALAAVVCVVGIGCVNAASLLLARTTVRARELATRAALGAARGRLARTLLIEGLMLSLAAASAAVVMSYWGVEVAKASLPAGLARASSIALNDRVLLAAVGVAIACGFFTGAAPAWRIARADLFGQLRVGGGVIGGRRQGRSLGVFLVAEVAFVTVLLVATALIVTSFVMVTTADLGFDRRNVVTLAVVKEVDQNATRGARRAVASTFFAEVLERARAVPGVAHAGLISMGAGPLGGSSVVYSLIIPGFGETKRGDYLETRGVSPGYFATMGLRVLHGRSFNDDDRSGAPAVAIINDVAARRFFSGRDPVAEVVDFNGIPTRIVGVLQGVRINGPEADLRTELYLPFDQAPLLPMMARAELVIRAAGSPLAVGAAVRQAIRPVVGPETATISNIVMETASEPRLLNDTFRRLTAARRFNAGLMTVFGVLAVAIGAIGIYGTMAFAVAQQARAIGLRMALGASQSNVLRSILRESLWRVGLGTLFGLMTARAVAGVFTSLVFGVTTTSPAVHAGVAVGLAAMGVLAALVPARRAARLDPLAALRAE
jgi:predicted permease